MRLSVGNFSKRKSLLIQNKAEESLTLHKQNSYQTCTNKVRVSLKSHIAAQEVADQFKLQSNVRHEIPEITVTTHEHELSPEHKTSSRASQLIKNPISSTKKGSNRDNSNSNFSGMSNKSLSPRKSLNSNSLTPKNVKTARLSPEIQNKFKKFKNYYPKQKSETPKGDQSILKDKSKLSYQNQSIETNVESLAEHSYGYASFLTIMSKIKEFIEITKQKSEFIQYNNREDSGKDLYSLNQSLHINQMCCQLDNIASMASSIKEKQASLCRQNAESDNLLNGVSSEKIFLEDYGMNFESEMRKKQYDSLFGSCKQTLSEVIVMMTKFIHEDSQQLIIHNNLNESKLMNDSQTHTQNKEVYKNVEILYDLSTQTGGVYQFGGVKSHRPSNGGQSNFLNISNGLDLEPYNNTPNFTARGEARQLERCDFQDSNKGFNIYKMEPDIINLKNSSESVDSASVCMSIKKRGDADISRTGKRKRVISCTGLSFKGNQSSDEEDFLRTNEEVTVNIPYDMHFEVNKNKDLFIRKFFTEAQIINKIIQTDYSFDTISCNNKEGCLLVLSDTEESNVFSKKKARSKSVLFQGYANNLDLAFKPKTTNLVFPHINDEAEDCVSQYIELNKNEGAKKKTRFKLPNKHQAKSRSSSKEIITELTAKKDSRDSVMNSNYGENAKFSKRNVRANLVSNSNRFKFFANKKTFGSSINTELSAAITSNQGELKRGRSFEKLTSREEGSSETKANGRCTIF